MGKNENDNVSTVICTFSLRQKLERIYMQNKKKTNKHNSSFLDGYTRRGI